MNAPVTTLNHLAERAVPFAADLLWQSGLLIVVLLALDLLLRHRVRAGFRYALWMLLLVKLVLPPALALPTGAGYWIERPTDQPVTPVAPLRPTNRIPATKLNTAETFDWDLASSDLPAIEEPAAIAPPTPRLTLAGRLLVGWLSGTAVLLGWILWRWLWVMRLIRRGEVAPDAVRAIALEANRALNPATPKCGHRRSARSDGAPGETRPTLGVGSSGAQSWARTTLADARGDRLEACPMVRVTDAAISPAVCGLFRPVIVLPRRLVERLSANQLHAVLLHELIHLRRGDLWVNCLQTLLQIACWWHPLLWLANSQIRRVREEAVDESVASTLRDDGDAYPTTLLEVAKLTFTRPLMTLGLVGILESKSALKQRIRRLLDQPPLASTRLKWWQWAAVIAFALVALPMAQGEKRLAPEATGQTETTSSAATPFAPSSTNPTPWFPGWGVLRPNRPWSLDHTNIATFASEMLSADVLWPDPRHEGYRALELKPRFLLLPIDGLKQALGDAFTLATPVTVGSNEVHGLQDALIVGGAVDHSAADPIQFGKFSGGVFHWSIVRDAPSQVRYVTSINATGKQVVVGAHHHSPAYTPDWAPLTLLVRPFAQETGSLDCLLGFSTGDYDPARLRKQEATVPTGGALFWASTNGVREGFAQMVVLRNVETEQTGTTGNGATNEPVVIRVNGDRLVILNRDSREITDVELDRAMVEGAEVRLFAERETPSIRLINLVDRLKKLGATNVVLGITEPRPDPYLERAGQLIESGRLDEAERLLREAARERPDDHEVQYHLDRVQQLRSAQSSLPDARPERNAQPRPDARLEDDERVATSGMEDWLKLRPPFLDSSAGRERIMEKLQSIRLEQVQFVDQTLTEVVKELADEVRRRDQERKGINFMIVSNVDTASTETFATDPATGAPVAVAQPKPETSDIGKTRVQIDPPIESLTLRDALDAIVQAADRPLKWTVEDFAVVFSARTPGPEKLSTRTYRVNPNAFYQALQAVSSNLPPQPRSAPIVVVQPGYGGSSGGVRSTTTTNDMSAVNVAVRDYFKAAGVQFEPPKMVYFNDRAGLLMVRATLEDLEIVQNAVELLNYEPPQVNLEVRAYELTSDQVKALSSSLPAYLFPPAGPADPQAGPVTTSVSTVLTQPQFAEMLSVLEQGEAGASTLTGPMRVTTLSGRQTKFKSAQVRSNIVMSVTNTPAGPEYVTEDVEVGRFWDITPEVGPDGYTIKLAAKFERREFLGYEDPATTGKPPGTPLPRFSIRQAESMLGIWDGHTLVMGGLPISTPIVSKEKVPVLGDLPWVGQLFRDSNVRTETKNVIVFITPTIIDPAGNPVNGPQPFNPVSRSPETDR